jgi:hypothetical protein
LLVARGREIPDFIVDVGIVVVSGLRQLLRHS